MKLYEEPKIEVKFFGIEDLITTSSVVEPVGNDNGVELPDLSF